MNDTDFLTEVSIFSHMRKRDLKRIAKRAQREVFREGDLIIKEGDRDSRLFVILRVRWETPRDVILRIFFMSSRRSLTPAAHRK